MILDMIQFMSPHLWMYTQSRDHGHPKPLVVPISQILRGLRGIRRPSLALSLPRFLPPPIPLSLPPSLPSSHGSLTLSGQQRDIANQIRESTYDRGGNGKVGQQRDRVSRDEKTPNIEHQPSIR